jgi:REP element-mobilizing transposase RayT
MAQPLSCILVHTIFSTKSRTPWIQKEIRKDLYDYMSAISRSYNSHIYHINGIEDHVHILLSLPRTIALADLIEEIKKGSSKWVKTKGIKYHNFAWQKGYGAFSIGKSSYKGLVDYIINQEEHHKKISFQDEYRSFLKKYEVHYDEKYVWD